ncbi:MAG: hypothetical protein AB8F94_15100 [Saprospiraceae bacterium]
MNFITSICFLICSFALNTESVPSFVDVFEDETKSIHIKSTLNKWQCNNKDFIPIDLPKNSKGIIYSVRAVKKSDFKSPQKMLLDEVKYLSKKHDPTKIADYINPNSTNRSFNLYLMSGNENIQSFNNCGSYNYNEKFINNKSRSGYISTENMDQETLYFGIENNHDLKNLRIIVEVVAIVYE